MLKFKTDTELFDYTNDTINKCLEKLDPSEYSYYLNETPIVGIGTLISKLMNSKDESEKIRIIKALDCMTRYKPYYGLDK